MKKLLSVLGACVLTASSISGVVACSPIDNNGESGQDKRDANRINAWFIQDSVQDLTLTGITNFRTVGANDVTALLQDQLNHVIGSNRYQVQVNHQSFQSITYDNDFNVFNEGSYRFSVYNAQEDKLVLNKTNKTDDFTIKFTTDHIKKVNSVLKVFANNQTRSVVGSQSKEYDIKKTTVGDIKRLVKSFFAIDLPLPDSLNDMTLGEIINEAASLLNIKQLFDLIPHTMPSLDSEGNIVSNKDAPRDWVKFTTALCKTISSLSGKDVKTLTVDKKVDLPKTAGFYFTLKVKTSFLGLLDGLAPDIIHMWNFYNKYKDQENILLIIIKYFLGDKQDVMVLNDAGQLVPDGFSKIDSDESGIKSNLDNLLFDALGNKNWKRSYYAWYKDDGGYKYHKLVNGEPPLYVHLDTYLRPNESMMFNSWDVTQSDLISVLGLNVNDVLKNFLAGLLNHDITKPVHFAIEGKIMKVGKVTFYQTDVPVIELWDTSIRNFLGENHVPIDEFNSKQFVVKKGLYVAQVKDGQEWKTLDGVDGINAMLSPTTTDVRIVIQNMQIALNDDILGHFDIEPFDFYIPLN